MHRHRISPHQSCNAIEGHSMGGPYYRGDDAAAPPPPLETSWRMHQTHRTRSRRRLGSARLVTVCGSVAISRARGARDEGGSALVRERRRRLVAVHDRHALADEDVAEERQERVERRQRVLIGRGTPDTPDDTNTSTHTAPGASGARRRRAVAPSSSRRRRRRPMVWGEGRAHLSARRGRGGRSH